MMQELQDLVGSPDGARSLLFVGYLAFMWGIVGLAAYFDTLNID